MSDYSREQAAARAGVNVEWLDELMALEALGAGHADRFTEVDVA